MLRMYNNLRFQTFHYGVKCYISSLSKNRLDTVDTWSKLEEIIQYLNFMAFDHKKNILSQQFLAIAPKMVGMKYSSDIVIRNFGYYEISRTLYLWLVAKMCRHELTIPLQVWCMAVAVFWDNCFLTITLTASHFVSHFTKFNVKIKSDVILRSDFCL